MRILAIGAHPDDVEIYCGGTLAKFRERKDSVVMAYVCQGDKGGISTGKIKLSEIRKKEAEEAARIIGAKSISLNFKDSEIFSTMEIRKAVIDLIRMTKPELIITHSPFDYHSDHRITGQVVTDATYIASSQGFKTKNPPLSYIPVVYYMDTFAGINFQPTEYVDISEFIEKKIEMIKCHKSQQYHLEKRGKIDIIEMVRDMAKFRGWQSGVRYAEGFKVCDMWPNFKTRRILP